MTGGCYPALAVVSSNAFGIDLLSSGLTQYEVKRLLTIKIVNSVILENFPQLFFQGLYIWASPAKLTNTVFFASSASLLSVTASLLTYFIDRDNNANEVEAVESYFDL